MKYLYDEQYYVDLYDLFTIKDCLEVIDTFREIYQKSLKDKATKDIPKEEKLKASNQLLGWQLFTTKGERYRNKALRLEEMIEADRKKQDFFDNASEPSNITCNTCGKKLFSETKILEDYRDTPMRVLFYYPCKTCKKKRSVYNTGEEFIVRPQLCPKCKHELIEKHTIKTKGKGKIFQAYLDGASQEHITDTMFELGLRTKTGKKVHRSAIARMLQDPFYIGKFRYNNEIYDGKHEALISEEMFEAVQDKLKSKTYIKKARPVLKKTKFLYRRRIKCNVCGCSHTPTLKKDKYRYYFCTNGKGICDQHKKYLSESKINNKLGEKISNFFLDKKLIDKSLEIYKQRLINNYKDMEKTLRNVNNQLETVKKRMSTLLDLYIDGKVEESAYNEKLGEFKIEEKALKKQIKHLEESDIKEIFKTLEQVRNRLFTMDELFNCEDFETKDSFLKGLLWNFSLENQEIASVQYRLPFKAFEKAGKTADMSIWLGSWDLVGTYLQGFVLNLRT